MKKIVLDPAESRQTWSIKKDLSKSLAKKASDEEWTRYELLNNILADALGYEKPYSVPKGLIAKKKILAEKQKEREERVRIKEEKKAKKDKEKEALKQKKRELKEKQQSKDATKEVPLQITEKKQPPLVPDLQGSGEGSV